MKHPPIQISDTAAKQLLEEFIAGTRKASQPVELIADSGA
jgi:hypothetical protein